MTSSSKKHIPQYYTCDPALLKSVSKNAIKVIQQLKKAGYEAYLVGGSVRDLWLGKKPKDFDVVTNANPEQVKPLFKRALLIGRRFRLVHVYLSNEIIEVSTFRSIKESDERVYTEHGTLLRDNLYGTMDEDAQRRDFTINALYFDITYNTIIDYVNGFPDLQAGIIRVIGDPWVRYREDPLRILRAIRLSAKIQFSIDAQAEAPFTELGSFLSHIPAARLLDELLKIYRSGHALDAIQMLKKHQLFQHLFFFLKALPSKKMHRMSEKMMEITLLNADKRIKEEKSLSTALLFAAFLWYPLQSILLKNSKQQTNHASALNLAIQEMLEKVQQSFLTRKMKQIVREIWMLQYFFEKQKSRQIYYAFHHRYFRNAYHLLNFRVLSGEDSLKELLDWWTKFIEADRKERTELIKEKK
jgi:poly(A) polymerase